MSEARKPPAIAQGFNKVAIRAAGSRLMPMWAKVEHRGRTSGKPYSTPVSTMAGPGCFYVGLPWGRGTDWVRNLQAANGGTVVWRGRRYAVTSPSFVSKEEVLPAVGRIQRTMLERWKLEDFLRLEHD